MQSRHCHGMTDNIEKLLWTYEETAERLSMTVQALRDHVYKGIGPKVTRRGRSVYFRPCDVHEWVDELAAKSV